MKKLAYLLVFIFVSATLFSCGASSQSCATTQTILVKNSKFETYEMVVATEMVTSNENAKSIKTNASTNYMVTNDDME